MKRKICLICFYIIVQNPFAQIDSVDATLRNMMSEKNDTLRIGNLYRYFGSIQEKDALENLEMAQHLLLLAEEKKDDYVKAYALCQLGYQSMTVGNNTKSLEYNLKALKIAERLNNPVLLAIVKNRLGHNALEPNKRLSYYKEAFKIALETSDNALKCIVSGNLGGAFFDTKELDSALFYLQKSEQFARKTDYPELGRFYLLKLGNVYAEMKNRTLALAYYNLALQDAEKQGVTRVKSGRQNAMAKFYYNENQKDSAIYYASEAIKTVQNTPFSNQVIQPSKLLMDIYKNINSDSAMKYAEMYLVANDSLNSLKTIQQNQLTIFDEEMRQRAILDEKLEAQRGRQQNIQYALIAIGIIIFITLFLMISRTIVVNGKWISFFSVLGLLVVFEFLNLLLHPFLERITHHSPLLMLLALVCIAALLIPLHHKIEKWATHKLVEKNKAVRLANAKKTIEQLEKKTENLD